MPYTVSTKVRGPPVSQFCGVYFCGNYLTSFRSSRNKEKQDNGQQRIFNSAKVSCDIPVHTVLPVFFEMLKFGTKIIRISTEIYSVKEFKSTV